MRATYTAKKDQIINTAAALSLRQGVSNTAVLDIANALGVSKGHVYHYFKSKEEIIDSIAETTIRGIDEIREYYKGLGNISATEALHRCIKFWLLQGHEDRAHNAFFDREFRSLSPEIGKRLTDAAIQNINFFEYRLDDGIKTGEFKVKNTRLVAFNIWASAHEWAVRRWFFRGFLTAEEYAEQQADFILNSIVVNKNL